ncbi:helix-turn-helix domain-containing protein [Longirhabdus pacifica]|uniref:helix-turn-helix domain-containing protein n=1 Tax=Longirhabdus pacifica TaxID=2305227 RepID=UPI0010088BD5|nr:helix-turn-helix transcriptional regulator [Longirhabdus pacifica]
MMKIETLGELVREYRERNEVTMGQLQEKLGINKGVISKIEKGDTKRPEFKTIFTLADELNIPHDKIIDRYVNVESRPPILHELLIKITSETDFDAQLVRKLALKYIESDKHETEDALESLYQYAAKTEDVEIRLILYVTIAEYARLRGIPPYIAKGLLQAYLIKRANLKTKAKTFDEAKEILYYIDFLSDREKAVYYFRMALQAFGIKRYEDCIEFCAKGLELKISNTELKARAHGAMINAYYEMRKYDEVEHELNTFIHYEYTFVNEFVTYTIAIVKVAKKEYTIAIPMLEKCLNKISKPQQLYVVIELLKIYDDLNNDNEMQKLFLNEEFLTFLNLPESNSQYLSVGKYFEIKGNFQIRQGLIDDGMISYMQSLKAFTEINAFEEFIYISNNIFQHFNESGINAKYTGQLNEMYINIINKTNGKGRRI